MKTIKGDLILTKNTEFDESIEVEGNIICKGERWNLTVNGNITAKNIDAWNIDARDIYAGNITAWDINAYDIDASDINALNITAWDINAYDIDASDINALNIDAENIDAGHIKARDINSYDIYAQDIICNKRIKKSKKAKTIARVFVQNKSKLERKEQMPEANKK